MIIAGVQVRTRERLGGVAKAVAATNLRTKQRFGIAPGVTFLFDSFNVTPFVRGAFAGWVPPGWVGATGSDAQLVGAEVIGDPGGLPEGLSLAGVRVELRGH